MKKLLSVLLCLLGWTDLCAQPAAAQQTPAAGHYTLTPATVISYESHLASLAGYLSDYLHLASDNRRSSDHAIVLATDLSLAPEAYRLTVGPHRIEITGGSQGGVFNGIQALFRLLPAEVYAKACPLPARIACTRIDDAPRFSYRGMMLDVARTWMGLPEVKRYVDLLSYHNINKLHLHLSDDEGWRIEIKSHPELATIGGYRGGDSPVRAVYGKWDQKYGGYYTQEQMRELINYAALRNIEIIPEIDLPGHSRNIASVRPEIRCNFAPDTLSTNGYDYRSAWCVAREANYELLTDILNELCDLFPSPYIHIGGDEVEMSQWEQCPDCRALIKSKGMTSTNQLQDLFLERMTEILAAKGKRPGVWNEATKTGSFTRECLVYGWQSVKACLEAADKGYQTIVMPGEYFYLDMRQTQHEEGHTWAAIFDTRKIYGFDFTQLGFTDEQMRNVAGVSATFFSELYISNEPEKPDYIDYMCFPRICALSHVAWGHRNAGWDTYYRELKSRHYDRMAAMGIRFRLSPPKVSYKEGIFTVTTDDQSAIFYLREGSTEEHRYTKPLRTDKPHLYRFLTRYKTARSPYVADKSYYRTLSPGLTITSSIGEQEKFPFTNASTYKSAARTRRACRQGDWILYTFNNPVRCREILLQTGYLHLPKTIFTTGYAEISYDGQNFERAGELEKGSVTLRPARPLKAVRLVSTCSDNGTPMVLILPPQIKPVL